MSIQFAPHYVTNCYFYYIMSMQYTLCYAITIIILCQCTLYYITLVKVSLLQYVNTIYIMLHSVNVISVMSMKFMLHYVILLLRTRA